EILGCGECRCARKHHDRLRRIAVWPRLNRIGWNVDELHQCSAGPLGRIIFALALPRPKERSCCKISQDLKADARVAATVDAQIQNDGGGAGDFGESLSPLIHHLAVLKAVER